MAAAQQRPDLDLAAVSLVRLGTPQTVARLCRLGGRVLAQGEHLGALVIAGDAASPDAPDAPDAPDREGVLDGIAGGWVLLTWGRRHRVLVVLRAAAAQASPSSTEDDEEEGGQCA